ncbi:PREDICTED: uncharacterized protein LOC18589958 isoform X1 [Theobroma cacao]|uniref:Biogenesis of lysosome-related organelles complex 1 subunit 7 n=1 Tax=Theobroma cacao TaxID=3641 RepID=A0AB32WVS4_THECC|nr:PREDICTED: uncharacterized protein LOC18589958 isoform X1 [Theobroma cacao]
MESKGSNDDDNATISDVSVEVNPSNSSPTPDSQSNNDPSDNDSTEALAKALSSMLTSLIKDFDSKAHDTLTSQDLLSSSIDRLTRELDQLLEDAPLPFIMQHAAKFSNVRKRVFSLNLLLKSIQRRIDNIDRMLSMGLQHVGQGNCRIVEGFKMRSFHLGFGEEGIRMDQLVSQMFWC